MSTEVVGSVIPLSTLCAGEAIVCSVVIALNKGQISDAVDQFADTFTFTDHALDLEFTQKEHLLTNGKNHQMVRLLRPNAVATWQGGRTFRRLG